MCISNYVRKRILQVKNLNHFNLCTSKLYHNKYNAINILRKIYDKNSLINCKLITYVLNNIVHNALYDK